jgi:MFS family permease
MKSNYRIYLASKAILSFASGIFGPFFVLFISQKGSGLESFGIAMGLLVMAQSITFYFAGRLSDTFGRKPFLVIEGYLSAVVVMAYLFISFHWQLYLLQIIQGILGGVEAIVGVSLLADLTETKTRGGDMGRFNAIVGTLTGLAMLLGGYIVGVLGISAVFVLMAFAQILYASLLLFMRPVVVNQDA